MLCLISLQLLSGIVFAVRTINLRAQRSILSEQSRPTLILITILLFLLGTFWLHRHPGYHFLLILIGCSALRQIDRVILRRLEKRIDSEFPGFLNQLILKMQTGQGLRSSVEDFFTGPLTQWKKCLHVLIESHVFLQINSSSMDDLEQQWCQKYVVELRQIFQNPHCGLDRLKSWRKKLRILSEFRRKSGQSLIQARIQLLTMSVLYIALLIFTLAENQWKSNRRLILLSMGLFVLSQIVFFVITRKRKWKV